MAKTFRRKFAVWLVAVLCALFVVFAVSILLLVYNEDRDDVESACRYFQRNSRSSNMVISLTTMPKRLLTNRFQYNLCTILRQTVRPERILLNVPYVLKKTGDEYVIPQWLEELSKREPTIEIVRCEDEGPATKYLPTLRRYQESDPNKHVIVCDDDSVMPMNQVEVFQRACSQYPDAVIAAGGMQFSSAVPFGSLNYTTGMHVFGIGKDSFVEKLNLIYGYTGYCLQPKMVDINRLSDFSNMPRVAFFVDDITLSAHLAERNVDRYVHSGLDVVRPKWYRFVFGFDTSETEALSKNDNADGSNEMKAIDYFRDNFLHDDMDFALRVGAEAQRRFDRRPY